MPEVFSRSFAARVFGRRLVEAPRRTQEKTSGTQCSTHLNYNEKLITDNDTSGGEGNVSGVLMVMAVAKVTALMMLIVLFMVKVAMMVMVIMVLMVMPLMIVMKMMTIVMSR